MACSPFSEVKNYKLENPKNITIGHLNINSLRKKFILIELIKSKLDIFLISESFRIISSPQTDIKHVVETETISVEVFYFT